MTHALPVREVRTVPGSAELRGETKAADLAATDPIPVTGHAAVFGQPTLIGDKRWGFLEEIDARAFDDVLEDDTRYLINHDPNRIMARTASGTLRLSTDKTGLVTDADLAPVSYARDLAILLERRDVTQMSFAFRVGAGGDVWRTLTKAEAEAHGLEEGFEHRTVLKIDRLYDVSAVTYPAYEGADVNLRAAEAILGERKERQNRGKVLVPPEAKLLNVKKNAETLRFLLDTAYPGRAR